MATINNTQKLTSYTPSTYPSLGNSDRFLANELDKIQTSIGSIISVMKMLEARMNNDGLA